VVAGERESVGGAVWRVLLVVCGEFFLGGEWDSIREIGETRDFPERSEFF
jgi:hypothetical protein